MHPTPGDGTSGAEEAAVGPGDARGTDDQLEGAGTRSVVREEGSGNQVDGGERSAAGELPTEGSHVWVTPDGSVREVSPGQLRLADPVAGAARRCSDCGGGRSVETVVREHLPCGRVGLDGFVAPGGEHRFACPKCDAVVDDPADAEAFAVVGTVHSCVACGRVHDRSLGRPDEGAPGRSGEPDRCGPVDGRSGVPDGDAAVGHGAGDE